MKILLTGSNGLVGKNVLEHAKAIEHEILSPSSHELNLLDRESINHYLDRHKPQFVIHCAGKVGGIQANMQDMQGFLTSNLMMGINLVESCKAHQVPQLLNLGSSCIYPKDIGSNIKEEDLLTGPLEPTNEGYAISKIAVLKLCEYISSKDEGFQYKTMIPCNIYGRHDHFNSEKSHMIPAVIMRMHKAVEENIGYLELWGDGKARREFMYAEDLADAIFFSVDNFHRLPQNFNAGLGYDYSILDYYQQIAKTVGFKGEFRFDLSKPKGMQQKLINVDRLKTLGWSAKHDLSSGLQKTYSYFQANLRSV